MTVQELMDNLFNLIESQNKSNCSPQNVRECEVVVNGQSIQCIEMFGS